MAGSFTGTSASPKDRGNYSNGPKGKKSDCNLKGGPFGGPEYPITDDFAAKKIPGFAERRANTNAKSGFNTVPAHPPAGRLAQRPPEKAMEVSVRGVGKEVGRDERARSGDSHGSGGSHGFRSNGKIPPKVI
jgi:hypothetical protein